MNQKSDVLVIGELNMDLIFNQVASFPELGKEKIANEMDLTLGGSSAIFAANASRLGLSVEFCAMVGNDKFGEQIIDRMQSFGVGTSHIIRSKKYNTGLTAIIRHAGDRAMLTFPGTMQHFSLTDIPDEAFQEARHLHISAIFLQPAIKKDLSAIINKAKSHGMTISIDTQWDPREKWDISLKLLLKNIDFLIPNETEFLQLTHSKTLDEGLQKLPEETRRSVIIKRDSKGASFWDESTLQTIPSFLNDNPVDSVGAGDSFDAGFIFRFLQGDSIEKCILFANLAGAASTTRAGGTAAINSLDDVLVIAKEAFGTDKFEELKP